MTLIATEARVDRGRMSAVATANSPHRISCDDGLDYAVKPTSADRQFVNEVLAIALGDIAAVPMFDAALVSMNASFLAASPSMAAKYGVGVHFGSRVPTAPNFNFGNVSPFALRSNVRNINDFYRLAVFDELIANTDRAGNPGNLVAVQLYNAVPALEFYAIDHGHAFTGPNWDANALMANVPAPVFPVLGVVRELLTSLRALQADAAYVSNLAERFGDAIENSRAQLDDKGKRAVLHLLTTRAPLLAQWVTDPAYKAHLPNLV